MSLCAVHMQKMKMSAMGGIQSHNQREHESRKNKEIDYEKSKYNTDTVLNDSMNYYGAVKDRIAELNLPKAVRKDAVVYCSFIVSSDREFFESLGKQEYIHRENENNESIAIGLYEPLPFEYINEEYREDCIREGATRFFEKATEFFQERYGEENVLNGTIHFDEYTPHMHLGLVPVTADGRLSAKEIFTPLELKQLQTEFAEKVGARFALERGKEGSEATHLDELSYKIKKRTEQLEKLNENVERLERNCKDLEKQAESLNKTVESLQEEVSTLDTEKRLLERVLEKIRKLVEEAIERAKGHGIKTTLAQLQGEVEERKEESQGRKALEYIEMTGQTDNFNHFFKATSKSKDRDGRW